MNNNTVSIGKIEQDQLQDIVNSFVKLKASQDPATLNNLKNSLNKFFKDTQCKEIIYTDNSDKLFFGMCVMPVITSSDVKTILFTSEKKRIDSYYIEIDSKILDPLMNMTSRELTACLLHEVGHLTNTTLPVDTVRDITNSRLAQTNDHIKLSSSVEYMNILIFGLKDSLRKISSMFNSSNTNLEIIADEFVVKCGFGSDLESALTKINKNSFKINKEVSNKLIVLDWSLRLYKNVKLKRIPAIHALKKSKHVTGSSLVKRDIDNTIRNLEKIDDEKLLSESFADVINAFSNNISNIFRNIKRKGIRSLDDDYFDLAIRVKNVTDEQDSLSILREINLRLSILDDYLRGSSLNDEDRKKAMDLTDKFREMRDVLSKKSTYKDKYYGLFVQTPVIQSRFDL